jgi:RNase P subunit RPR2
MIKRKPKLIYCTKCLTPINVIKNIKKEESKDIIDIFFVCSNCGHESGEVIHEKDIRGHRINKLID